MARDWIDGPEYDRWRTDPEWRSAEQKEFDRMTEAYDQMSDWYERHVVTNFTGHPYKPGDQVKWLGKDNEQLKGVVIGATEVPAAYGPVYVILKDGKKKQVVEVDEISLMHGWDQPPEEPVKLEPPMQRSSEDDDDIPF